MVLDTTVLSPTSSVDILERKTQIIFVYTQIIKRWYSEINPQFE